MFEERMKITSEIIRQESNVKDGRERDAGHKKTRTKSLKQPLVGYARASIHLCLIQPGRMMRGPSSSSPPFPPASSTEWSHFLKTLSMSPWKHINSSGWKGCFSEPLNRSVPTTHTLCFYLCDQPTRTFIPTGVYSDCFFLTCGFIFSLNSVVCNSENQIVCKRNHLQFKLTSIPPWSRISVWKRCKSQF